MDLRRLQFLVRVIDMGSITRAAAALRIAQPALSQHIQVLERSLGTPLLVRSQNGVVPTEAGRIAYRNAMLMARQVDLTRAEVKNASGVLAGKVSVGVAPHSHARAIIQPLLYSVAARHPGILLHVAENFEGLLTEQLRVRRLDVALVYEVVPRPGLIYRQISTETLTLVGARHLLEPPAGVGPIRLILPSSAHALRQLIDAELSASRTRASIVAEVESFETLANAVVAGLGATVFPRSVAAPLAKYPDITMRAFGAATAAVTLSLATVDEGPMSPAAQAVAGMVAKLAEDTEHV